MALVAPQHPTTATTDPTAHLVAAIAHFESVLTDKQRRDYRAASVRPAAPDVIAFVTKLDSDNQAQTRRCVASRLCTFLNAAQQFTQVVDTFVSANPAIAALIWGSIKFTIVAASNVASYFDKVTNMIMTVGKFCPVYRKFEQLFASSADLQYALCDYYAAVIRLCEKIVEVSRRPAPRQLLTSIWNPFDTEFKTCRDELDQATKLVDLHVRLAAEQAAEETAKLSALERQENRRRHAFVSTFRTDVQREHEDAREWRLRQSYRRTSKLRSSIRDNLSTIDYLKAWKYVYQQRTPATAEWLQDDPNFLSWRRDERTAIMWCPGILGIGKTVLASNIVAHLQQTRTSRDVICHHFCDAQNRTSLSARMILGTLAQQMMSIQIDRARDDDLDNLSQLTKDLEARDVFESLLPYLSQDQRYYLVLDGLDEVELHDIDVVAQSIAMLCEKRIKDLKIIYTGRPELGQCLFRSKNFDYQAAVVKSRLMNDVDRYSEVMLDRLLEEETLRLGDPRLILKIRDTLQTASEGIFLWTRLFIEEICARTSDNEILEALRSPPRKISELIAMKMDRLRGHNASHQALKLLRYCGVLKRPLEVDEYRELLGIATGQQSFDQGSCPNDLTGIVAACYGLVTVDPEENVVRYIHHSIRQYLFSSDALHEAEFHECDSDTYIGELCLTYLNFGNFRRQLAKHNAKMTAPVRPVHLGLLSVTQPGSFTSRVARKLLRHREDLKGLDFQRMEGKIHELTQALDPLRLSSELQQNQFLFLSYARQYWIDHLKQLDKDRNAGSWGLFCKAINDGNSLATKPWLTGGVTFTADLVGNIVHWSTNNGHSALLFYVLWTQAEVLTEVLKKEILCYPPATSLWAPRLVSTAIQRAKCKEDRLTIALLHAAQSGQKNWVAVYLDTSISLDRSSSERCDITALQVAIKGGHLNVADRLLEAGANLDGFGVLIYGSTPLQAAADGGHLDIVNRLLTAGADVNAAAATHRGRTALQAAVERGHFDVVDKLLTAGSNVNAAAATYGGTTALQAAIKAGHLDIVERLRSHGACE